jgi:hypothetical protein
VGGARVLVVATQVAVWRDVRSAAEREFDEALAEVVVEVAHVQLEFVALRATANASA